MSELTPRQIAAAKRIADREKLRAGTGLPPEPGSLRVTETVEIDTKTTTSLGVGGSVSVTVKDKPESDFVEKIKDTPVLVSPLSAVDYAETKLLTLEARHAELVDKIREKEAELADVEARNAEVKRELAVNEESQKSVAEALVNLNRQWDEAQKKLEEARTKIENLKTKLTDEPAHPYNSDPTDLFHQFLGTVDGIAVTDPRVPRDTGALMSVLDDNAKRAFMAGLKAGRGA